MQVHIEDKPEKLAYRVCTKKIVTALTLISGLCQLYKDGQGRMLFNQKGNCVVNLN